MMPPRESLVDKALYGIDPSLARSLHTNENGVPLLFLTFLPSDIYFGCLRHVSLDTDGARPYA